MDEQRIRRFLSRAVQSAGKQIGDARQAYSDAKRSALADLPQDDAGRAKIVCRRDAERRAVSLDEQARPVCFDPDHQDCQGCVEDIDAGVIETW